MMRIAIPIAGGTLCMHFGHCEQFALVDIDYATKAILSTTYMTTPPHEPGVLPRWLSQQGVNAVIAGGMGQRARALFAQNGIQVILGVPSDRPDRLVCAYLDGTLQTGQNICDH